MPLETRVKIKDLIGNPKCRTCYGRGWVWITPPKEARHAQQCECARAIRTFTRNVEPVT